MEASPSVAALSFHANGSMASCTERYVPHLVSCNKAVSQPQYDVPAEYEECLGEDLGKKKNLATVVYCIYFILECSPATYGAEGGAYLQSMDFQREPQSKHRLYFLDCFFFTS